MTEINDVIYRDFEKRDIPELATLVAGIWNPTLKGETALMAGKVDLAHFAVRATHWKVAELDGEVVGVAAVRVGDPVEEDVRFWSNLSDDAFAKLKQLSLEAEKALKVYYDFENKAHDQMLKYCDCDTTYELTLFAVSSKARGHGVGSELLRQMTDHLKEAGAKNYFLYTDTNCSWQYYENRGMKRCTTYVAEDETHEQLNGQELYIYSTSI